MLNSIKEYSNFTLYPLATRHFGFQFWICACFKSMSPGDHLGRGCLGESWGLSGLPWCSLGTLQPHPPLAFSRICSFTIRRIKAGWTSLEGNIQILGLCIPFDLFWESCLGRTPSQLPIVYFWSYQWGIQHLCETSVGTGFFCCCLGNGSIMSTINYLGWFLNVLKTWLHSINSNSRQMHSLK